jgi:hypothetical protein
MKYIIVLTAAMLLSMSFILIAIYFKNYDTFVGSSVMMGLSTTIFLIFRIKENKLF